MPYVHEIFDGARAFGLTDEQAWQTFDDTLAKAGPDATMSEYFELLTAELARRILDKHRGQPVERPRVASRDPL